MELKSTQLLILRPIFFIIGENKQDNNMKAHSDRAIHYRMLFCGLPTLFIRPDKLKLQMTG